MPDKGEIERKTRADKLRQEIEKLKHPDDQGESREGEEHIVPSETPAEFIRRKMDELEREKDNLNKSK